MRVCICMFVSVCARARACALAYNKDEGLKYLFFAKHSIDDYTKRSDDQPSTCLFTLCIVVIRLQVITCLFRTYIYIYIIILYYMLSLVSKWLKNTLVLWGGHLNLVSPEHMLKSSDHKHTHTHTLTYIYKQLYSVVVSNSIYMNTQL